MAVSIYGVDAQVKQLREAGVEKVFRETASGARSDRAGLARAQGGARQTGEINP
jgi:hypothetical protein